MSRPEQSIHGQWSSRWAFILAATGSAVGLGNIWKFPYITGENGGGAFVLVYLICIIAIGLPVMMTEVMLGRRGRQNPVDTMQSLAGEANTSSFWKYIGWSGVIAGFLILSYYSVFAGQAIAYVIRAFAGVFEGVTPDGSASLYNALTADPERLLAWHTLFIVFTMVVVAHGVKQGLEKAVRFLMPALFAILMLLVGYSISLGESFDLAIDFLFSADFSKLTAEGILTAMGHAFFTLSLGMGAIMIYGSYLPNNTSIAGVSLSIAFADTLVAILAGLAIFPLVFAHQLTPGAGPGLIFQTLPIAFGHIPAGNILGGLFFLLLVFAAWSSAISLIEPAVTWLIEKKGQSRIKASVITGFVTWLLGLLTVFSFNIGSDWLLFGKTAFDLLDYLTSNIMLPLGGLLIAVFAGWIMKNEHVKSEINFKSSLLFSLWQFLLRYVTPIAVSIVFLNGLGVFN
jgi:NSS family neurotransmitter:Na+ symporter